MILSWHNDIALVVFVVGSWAACAGAGLLGMAALEWLRKRRAKRSGWRTR